MAYKTKAEKKAFRAGMKYQEKRGTLWEVSIRNKGRSHDLLFKAPTQEKAKAAYLAYAKKSHGMYNGAVIEGISKHPVNYD